jgi:hypothetical protein
MKFTVRKKDLLKEIKNTVCSTTGTVLTNKDISMVLYLAYKHQNELTKRALIRNN